MIQVDQYGPVTIIRMARGFLRRPLEWTAAYFVDGLLIDAGPRRTEHELVRALDHVDVKQIVITHGHEDKIGGLLAVRTRFPAAEIYASRATVPVLQEPSLLRLQTYRRIVWGSPRPVEHIIQLDEVSNCVRTGDYEFRAIETPGHCRGHIALFEPTYRWLFTGDTYVGGRERAWTKEADMFALLGSLRTLAGLRPERLFPGSGNVRRTPQPDLYEKINYYTKLCEQVGRLTSAGFDFDAIKDRLVVHEPPIHRWTFGHHSAANLIRSCIEYNLLVQPSFHATPDGTPTDDRSISDSMKK